MRRDAPDHTRLRRLVSKAFTPRSVEAQRPGVQSLVDEAIDRAADRGHIELIAELAYPMPITTISRLLGLPAEDHLRIQSWSRAQLCCSFEASGTLPGEAQRQNCTVQSDLTAYFAGLITRRRRDPGDDLLSALIAAEELEDKLTVEEVNATARLLLVGGHETTLSLIANGMLALLRHPDQLELLRRQPSLMESAVEEVLRYDPPFQFVTRIALEHLEVGGYRVARGKVIVLWLAAGNRDGARFPEPDRFDITRASNHHLAFGAGAHFCLGAPLARLQGEVALQTLVQRLRARKNMSTDDVNRSLTTVKQVEGFELFPALVNLLAEGQPVAIDRLAAAASRRRCRMWRLPFTNTPAWNGTRRGGWWASA